MGSDAVLAFVFRASGELQDTEDLQFLPVQLSVGLTRSALGLVRIARRIMRDIHSWLGLDTKISIRVAHKGMCCRSIVPTLGPPKRGCGAYTRSCTERENSTLGCTGHRAGPLYILSLRRLR